MEEDELLHKEESNNIKSSKDTINNGDAVEN